MKNFTKLALLLITTAAIFTVHASSEKANLRKEKREQQKQLTIEKTKAAIAEQNFNFYVQSYSLPYESPVQVNISGKYYLDFYSQDVAIDLPMKLSFQSNYIFSNMSMPYSDFTVKDTGDGVNYIITAKLNNVSNNNVNTSIEDQGVNLGIHMTVNTLYRNATLTITPDFAASTTYQGSIIIGSGE